MSKGQTGTRPRVCAHTLYSVQNQFSICQRGPYLPTHLPSGSGERMMGRLSELLAARTMRCRHLPHLPGRVHGDAQSALSHWLFWLGLKEWLVSHPHILSLWGR